MASTRQRWERVRVLLGNSSCAAGTSLIEASLENAPYTTYTTDFTILTAAADVPRD